MAAALGKQVEFDDGLTAGLADVSVINFRLTDVGKPFTASRTSGDLRLDGLTDKSDAWLKRLILKLAGE